LIYAENAFFEHFFVFLLPVPSFARSDGQTPGQLPGWVQLKGGEQTTKPCTISKGYHVRFHYSMENSTSFYSANIGDGRKCIGAVPSKVLKQMYIQLGNIDYN